MTGGASAMVAGLTAALLAMAAPPAAAQETGASTPTVPPAALPTPTAAPIVTLPTPEASASPAAPRPRATATAHPAPQPTKTPAAEPAPAPAATATPTPVPTPEATTSPAATPVPASPTSAPSALPPPAPAPDEGTGSYWLAAVGALAVAGAALAWVLLRRRRADPAERAPAAAQGRLDEVPAPPTAEPVMVDPATAAPVETGPSFLDRSATGPSARLSLSFRPIRAGLNLLSATSESEIIVTNDGDVGAEDVRLFLRLVSAHNDLDAELTEIAAAAPEGRPVVPPFALAPGESRSVNAVGALPREALRPMTAAGRPMVVPVVALNLCYRSGGAQRQNSQAFAIGIERVDSPKLAPFWLDTPTRSFDQVAARPHGPLLER